MNFSILTCSFHAPPGLRAARAQLAAQKGVEIEHLNIDAPLPLPCASGAFFLGIFPPIC